MHEEKKKTENITRLLKLEVEAEDVECCCLGGFNGAF